MQAAAEIADLADYRRCVTWAGAFQVVGTGRQLLAPGGPPFSPRRLIPPTSPCWCRASPAGRRLAARRFTPARDFPAAEALHRAEMVAVSVGRWLESRRWSQKRATAFRKLTKFGG